MRYTPEEIWNCDRCLKEESGDVIPEGWMSICEKQDGRLEEVFHVCPSCTPAIRAALKEQGQ